MTNMAVGLQIRTINSDSRHMRFRFRTNEVYTYYTGSRESKSGY